MKGILACITLALLLGCSSAPPSDETRTDVIPSDETRTDVIANDLVTSLEVRIERDTVGFVLHLTNQGTQPVVLEFNSAQRYDFEVRTAAGETVWRWSDDMNFAQMLGTETVPAGASREYRESWAPGNRSGAFVAIGRVVASNRTIEQRTNFEIPR